MVRSILAKAAVAVVALGAVAATPVLAQSYPYTAHAQSYGGYDAYDRGYADSYRGGDYYDPCVRDQRQRQVTGGLVGAGIGALAGRGVASRNARTEGGVLGAVVGAVAGASIGRSTAACDSDYGRYDSRYDDRYDLRHDDRYVTDRTEYRYGDRYEDRYAYAGGASDYGYDRRYEPSGSYGYPAYGAYGGYGERCAERETRTRDAWGREEVRRVRTCRTGY